jgi:SagB-type dehydrogenase family enzyme
VTAQVDPEGVLCVQGPVSRVLLRRLAPAMREALCRLTPPGEEEDHLTARVAEEGGPGALAGWWYWLRQLAGRGLVCRIVQMEGMRLATLVPTGMGYAFAPVTVDRDVTYRLSRFAYLHCDGDDLVLESPLAHARVIIEDARVLAALAKPATTPDLGLLLGLLAGAGLLEREGEEEPAALRSWEFHDLLFHARSREGRSDAAFGATYRMAGQLEPPPAVKPGGPGEVIALARADLQRLRKDDVPLTEVLEERRSLREYGAEPISLRELGEFLFRVARVRDHQEMDTQTPAGPVRLAFAPRPYPAGGGLYELEFYVAVGACTGLDDGLYHYDPLEHQLRRLCGRTDDVERLLADAAGSAGIELETVQVLLVLAARFGRLAWKYSSIAYALTLKHVGVVYQTMYLTATAMGLAPCALGGGDADLFARTAGIEYYEETSVGEFLLGSRPHLER